ncbi:trigger factor [Mycoplasmopsis pulmonis]|uniref:trigger factor n=1 Tax=Mycoplasmopsis pulmonis TaxID=2107 RepID=UPI0010051DD0|nr:trigger factor [Mycoplasmopsis pulmonis]VEU68549.1 Trigger factor [Mycoplasmopsis pulmonis]
MSIKTYDKENSEIHVKTPVESTLWKQSQKKAFNKLKSKINIPGFRKNSSSPQFDKIARAKISKNDIWAKAIDETLNSTFEIARKELDKEDLERILGRANYRVSKITEDEAEIEFFWPVRPEIEDFKYKNLNVKFKEVKVTKKDIDQRIQSLMEMGAPIEESNEPAELENEMVFDFKGFIDGEEFEGGSAEEFKLKLGSKSFIPGFEDQLVGLKAGDEKEIKVTFPADYYVEEYAGKESVFKILVHKVFKPKAKEINDETIKELGFKGVSNLEQLKEYLRPSIEHKLLEDSLTEFKNEAFNKIKELNDIKIPRGLLLEEMTAINEKFNETLKAQGLKRREYLEMTKLSEEKVAEQVKKEAITKINEYLIFEQIKKAENVTISDDIIEDHYNIMAKNYNIEVDKIKEFIPVDKLKEDPNLLNEQLFWNF